MARIEGRPSISASSPSALSSSCWPWSHEWTKWETTEKGELMKNHPGPDSIAVGLYEYQRRVCVKCGKSQLRKVESV